MHQQQRIGIVPVFYVYHEGFVNVNGLIKEKFVVVNNGFYDEGKAVKDVEDDVMEGALIVAFAWIPEFSKIIIGNCVGEEVVQESLNCNSIICFFAVSVGCFEFSMAGSHCASRDIRIWAWVMWDNELVAIACKIKIVLHGESKMFHKGWGLPVHFGWLVVGFSACWHMWVHAEGFVFNRIYGGVVSFAH